jgi:hypothetical protein
MAAKKKPSSNKSDPRKEGRGYASRYNTRLANELMKGYDYAVYYQPKEYGGPKGIQKYIKEASEGINLQEAQANLRKTGGDLAFQRASSRAKAVNKRNAKKKR